MALGVWPPREFGKFKGVTVGAEFYLGLSLALLCLPLGISLGTNFSNREELKKFNETKNHLLNRVLK